MGSAFRTKLGPCTPQRTQPHPTPHAYDHRNPATGPSSRSPLASRRSHRQHTGRYADDTPAPRRRLHYSIFLLRSEDLLIQRASQHGQDSSPHLRHRSPPPSGHRCNRQETSHRTHPLLRPKFEDVHALAPQWRSDDQFLDTQNDRGYPLPRLVVDTAFTRRLGISYMPVHLVPVVALTPNSAKAWIVRLIAARRPIVLEVFRTRQESLLASFIIRTLRKGSDNLIDVGDILKALRDAGTVNTAGSKAGRTCLCGPIVHNCFGTLVIHEMVNRSPQATGKAGLLQEMQRLSKTSRGE